MIFVEGADNSGKTTLCEALAKEGFLIQSREGEGSCKMINFLANSQLTKRNVIFDRSRVISELVYGAIIRKKVALDIATIQNFLDCKPLVIYCRPKDSLILSNGSRNQMEGVLDNHPALITRYDEVMSTASRYGARVVNYDYSLPGSFDRVVGVIKKELQDRFEVECATKVLQDPRLFHGTTVRGLQSISEVQRYQVSRGKQ